MFETDIKVYGKHAILMKKYSKKSGTEILEDFVVDDNEGKSKSVVLFDTMMSCYMCAAMLGIINRKKADEDVLNKNIDATIFLEMINKNKDNLNRIYAHMVLSTYDKLSNNEKIKKAFSQVIDGSGIEEQKELESYMRGGLEIIDDLFGNSKTYEEVATTIYKYFNEVAINN